MILMGATGPKIRRALEECPAYDRARPALYEAGNMEEAVGLARKLAQPGDIVALSPASASFDLYPNFEKRGDHFKALVAALQ